MNEDEFDPRELLHEINDLVQSVDVDGRFLYVNRAWLKTLGYGESEVDNLNISDIIHPGSKEHCMEMFQRVMKGEKVGTVEAEFVTKAGKAITVEGSSNCSLVDGKPVATRSIFRDVTGRKEAEKALRDREDLFKAFMNNSPVVGFMKDEQGRYIYVNKRWEALFSMPQSEILGKTDLDWIAGETGRQFWENDRKVLESGQALELLETLPDADGKFTFWTVLKFPFTSASGQKFVGGAAIEVTSQKEAEEKLRQSERDIKTLVENLHDVIARFDKNFRNVYVNPALHNEIGVSSADFIGKTVRELGLPDEFCDAWDEELRKVFATGEEIVFEPHLKTVKGLKYYQCRLTPELATDNTVESVLVIAHEITGRKEMEERLRNLILTDDLTNLYNRRGFLLLAERQLQVARRASNEKNNYLIFADVDGLKNINDTFGHDNGSLAIVKMGEILSGNFRGSDIIARLGGDEFVVLMVNAEDDSTQIVMNRLQSKIESYNEQKNHLFDLSLSIGVTPIDVTENKPLEEILAEADRRMYEQKRNRKNLKEGED